MVKKNNNCIEYYDFNKFCEIYLYDKNILLSELRQNGILSDKKYLNKSNKMVRSKDYNSPTKDYKHMFVVKNKTGKNGYANKKIFINEIGIDYITANFSRK